MTRFVRFPSLLVMLAVVSFSTAFAGGDRFSPRIVGMGRAFTALSRGLDAVGTNPANLALNDRDATVTLNIAPLGFSVGSDFINLKVYNDFFTGMENPADPGGDRISRPLTAQDKEDILALFPGGTGRTQFGTEISPLGLSLQVGDFGLGISPYVEVAGNLDLTQDYMKFALNGFEPNGSVYSFNGTAVNASAVAGANASFGYVLPVDGFGLTDIAVGVGVKYLIGIAYIATDHYDGSIRTIVTPSPVAGIPEEIEIRSDLDFMQFVAVDTTDGQPVGKGMGFDIGLNATVLDLFQVGVAVTDIGSVKWDKYTKAVIGRASLSLTKFDQAAQDSLSSIFKGETRDTTAFEFDLPTQVHIGVAARMDDIFDVIPFRWTVAADLHLGLNEVAGNTKIPQFAIGTELDPLAGWLPLRTGIMIGGRERFAWSAGFGIHILNTFDLDFATQSLAIISNPETYRTGSFTMGMRLRF
ncbi:MAG: hypothetical protein F9K22_08520 [Bacteroidetes bacterium]|nr:MAG: hypothetical protein F9K22_08520 [Bacteroidota bacterium]